MVMTSDSVVWEWPERRGLEHLQLQESPDGTKAEGLVVVDASERVLRFRYSISLGSDGQLRRCGIFVPGGTVGHSIFVSLDQNSKWMVDRKSSSGLEKCVAFDICDSPFPKTLIVRNLALEVGQSKNIWVCHIDNRQLVVTPVQQH